jgi:1,2-diacylglycerol 3-alpha-glucosyltransferase
VTNAEVKVAVLWVHFGPYHFARLKALGKHVEVLPVELAASQTLYGWRGYSRNIAVSTLHAGAYEDANHAQLMRGIWGKLRELSPDVLLIPGYREPAALAAAAWGRMHGRKTVLMSDSTFEDSPRSAAREAVKRMVLKLLFDRALVSGKRAARYLASLGFREEQIARSYDVIDNDFYSAGTAALRQTSASQGGVTAGNGFLFVGRLAPEKNVDGLIRSYQEYRRAGGSWGLALAGEGPLSEELRRRAEPGSGEDGIHFAGHKSPGELLAYYAHAKGLILPSTRDPWGLVVNEAMASGLPVIVSNRCGCADDLVEHGGNGFLFDPSREDELTECMLRLSAMTEEERAAMGRRSKEIIRNYSLETWAAEVTRIAGN